MRTSSFELTTASPQVILYDRMYLNKEMRAFSAALPSLRRSQTISCLSATRCTPAHAVQVPVHVALLRHESFHLRQSASAKSVLTKLMDIIRDKM